MRRIWSKDENGQRGLMDRPKRTQPWYWMSGAGGCFFSVWYDSRALKRKPGMTAIQVPKRDALPYAIRVVIEAVQAGEPHAQIDAGADEGTAELCRKAPSQPLKKAS
jgi:hypothetical protein